MIGGTIIKIDGIVCIALMTNSCTTCMVQLQSLIADTKSPNQSAVVAEGPLIFSVTRRSRSDVSHVTY